MKKEILNVRLSTFDYNTLNFICKKYKCTKADAIKKAIQLLVSWDLEECNRNLESSGVTRPVNYEKGIE